MVRLTIILMLLSGLPTAGASTNDATTSVETMAASADVIALVRVASVTCSRDDRSQIFTTVRFDEGEIWKGPIKPAGLRVVQAGGTLGRVRTVATPSSTFTPGEWTVLFLALGPDGECVVLGADQGRLMVSEKERTVFFPPSFPDEESPASIRSLKSRIHPVP